jgi:tetratricopeptide (TPR) repeat protein
MTSAVALGYLLAYPLVLLASWLLLIALHEGGHALAALALLSGPVQVYLGSHGPPAGNYRLRLGRLQVFVRPNPLKWRGGCCYAQSAAGRARWLTVVFIVAGPLLPLLVASLGFYLGMQAANGAHRVFLLIFLFAAAVSAAKNLLPDHAVAWLPGGQHLGNDGFQLRQLLFPSGRERQAARAVASLTAGNYAESVALYLALLTQTPPTYALLGQAIYALLLAGRYAEALALSTRQHQDFAADLTDDDRFTQALLLSRLGQHQAALAAYTALLDRPQPYPLAYDNRGYTHNLLGNHALALADFDQALAHDAEPAYTYANRGLALLGLGQEAAGLADIRRSLALDPVNAYAHRNLGIYYLDRGEPAAALRYLEQARQLDPTTHELAAYLQKAHQHLARGAGASGPN